LVNNANIFPKMNKKEIKSNFIEYHTTDKLSEKTQNLLSRAKEAASRAYAPYSKFQVGAAVILEHNIILEANNQENAAYPSGLCAERVAIFYANSKYPDSAVLSIAVTAIRDNKLVKEPIPPCGSCLQVLLETERRFNNKIDIYLYAENKIIHARGVEQFLPYNFDIKSLRGD